MTVPSHRRVLRATAVSGALLFAACGGTTFGTGDQDGDAGEPGAGTSNSGTAGRASSAGAGTQSGSGGNAGSSKGGGAASGHAGAMASGASGTRGEGGEGESGAQGGTNTTGGNGARGGVDAAGGSGALGGVGAAGTFAAGSGGAGSGGGPPGGSAGALAGAGPLGGAAGTVAGSGGTLTAGAPSGGSSGKGGTSGVGGAPSPCTPSTVIDDMEDADDLVCPNQMRAGDWWTATGTKTGTINPPTQGNFPAFMLGTDARQRSSYGMRLSGQDFGYTDDDWASLGFYLASGGAYDLSSYQGLAFYAKSKSGAFSIHVKFATSTTTPTSESGACQADCNDHYRMVVDLDGSWREFSIPFASITQEGWGEKPKDLAHTHFVYFGFLGTDGDVTAFDFLIDDVRLY